MAGAGVAAGLDVGGGVGVAVGAGVAVLQANSSHAMPSIPKILALDNTLIPPILNPSHDQGPASEVRVSSHYIRAAVGIIG